MMCSTCVCVVRFSQDPGVAAPAPTAVPTVGEPQGQSLAMMGGDGQPRKPNVLWFS